jgi:pimeloyl-ACP methyl ester carboxylesterase
VDPLIQTISGWDGLPLCIRVWLGRTDGPPLLCLPGIVRAGADFEGLAAVFPGYRVVTMDYAGRGGSGRARLVNRYAPRPVFATSWTLPPRCTCTRPLPSAQASGNCWQWGSPSRVLACCAAWY